MRIAFFSDSYDSYRNYNDGVAVIGQNFTNYAVRKGLYLSVFTNDYSDSTEEVSETVKIHRFRPTIPWYLYKYHETPLDLLVPNPKLMSIFRQTQFDIVHFTQPCIMGLNAIYAAGKMLPRFPLTVPAFMASADIPFLRKKRNKVLPLIGSFHTNAPAFAELRTGSKFFKRFMEDMVNHFYQNCDIVLATSRYTQKELSHYVKGKVFGIFRSGVNTDSFHPQKRDESFRKSLDDKTILFFAGRMTPEKNLGFLKDVYVKLLQKHSDIFIAGDGEIREYLQRELRDKVTTPGFLYKEDLYRAFASSDIFVFPSTTDTLGLVVLEAQASGLPVIVTDQGGAMEVMEDGETGFLCNVKTIDDFVEKIDRLITNKKMREDMGRKGRILAEQYSWDRAFDSLLKVYEEFVKNV